MQQYIVLAYFKNKNFITGLKLQVYIMNNSKSNLTLTDTEWQTVLDALSNTIFNQDLTEEARKNAKELFLKLQKELPNK